MLQTLLDQFIETDGVDKESSVDTVNELIRDVGVRQHQSVDTVPRNRLHMLRIEQHSRDVKVLGILQGLINPRLQYFMRHLDLTVLRIEARALVLLLDFFANLMVTSSGSLLALTSVLVVLLVGAVMRLHVLS